MRVYSDAARDDEVVGLAWKIQLDSGETRTDNRYLHDNYTSMEAEYFAMLDGIRFAKRESTGYIEVLTDCDPLVKKMRAPDANNQIWFDRREGCHRLLNKFDDWDMEWTPRTSNSTADRLAFEALEEGRRDL